MQRIMCKSKISGLKITHKGLQYQGSIELPPEVLEAADIFPGEMILVINEYNGARFETYAIKGKQGRCGLLGGAARLGEVGDRLLVISSGIMDSKDAKSNSIKVVFLNEDNKIVSTKKH
ncbi:MAG: aspartate 1-decarboxylase [bacterium]|nr:aspartate 1-decarboxylase [bacterium]